MTFAEGSQKDAVSYADKEKAVFLAKIMGKSIENTNFGKSVITKALGAGAATSAHLPSQTWEHEVSMTMEAEIRRRLVSGDLGIRSVPMQTNVMSFPVNPEAGLGTWVTNAQFGTDNSSGAAATHALKEVTLNTYKLATKEYMNFEEEEDSLIVILPIVRDAMVRRTARSVDRAIFLGTANGTTDPIKGLAKYDEVSAVTAQVANAFTTAHLRALRKDLGAWGLDPSEVVYVVNTEAYYDLMEDALFQTMDKVGDKATILTGQVGMVGGSPVVVSAELPAKTSGANTAPGIVTNVGAIAINASNFLLGTQRGLRFDTDDIVAEQRKVLVASLRMGMTQISTVNGLGVSTFRWLV
jgi:HK97 family phage major capsid protein